MGDVESHQLPALRGIDGLTDDMERESLGDEAGRQGSEISNLGILFPEGSVRVQDRGRLSWGGGELVSRSDRHGSLLGEVPQQGHEFGLQRGSLAQMEVVQQEGEKGVSFGDRSSQGGADRQGIEIGSHGLVAIADVRPLCQEAMDEEGGIGVFRCQGKIMRRDSALSLPMAQESGLASIGADAEQDGFCVRNRRKGSHSYHHNKAMSE